MPEVASVRILYMEDDMGLARLLQKSLKRQGYVIDIAGNGEEGLVMVESCPYDIVLVDYHMPVCSGLDVLRIMADRGNFPPVIMVTGNGNEKIAVEALKLGATDYIVKDVDMAYLELLPLVLEQVLQKQQLINEKELMFAALQENEERYRKLVDLSPDGIAILVKGRFVFVNPAGVSLLGASIAEEFLGTPLLDFVHHSWKAQFTIQMIQLEENGFAMPWEERKLVRSDSTPIDVEMSGVPFSYQGKPAIQVIFRDITERKLAKERLEHMAHFDALTSLPNRVLFFDRLRNLLEQAKRYDHMFALLFLDLDRFKTVNDTLGHDMGDLLLKEAAKRVTACLRRSDTVARMGGDEFAVILTRINESNDAAVVARKVIDSLAAPFTLNGQECSIGVSIGISAFPGDGDDTETLLKRADTAMYRVKEDGRKHYRFYNGDGD